MNQQNAPSFAYDIPSIHQKRPVIPVALGNLDLNRQIAAGDALDYQPVTHAKSVAATLKGLRGKSCSRLSALGTRYNLHLFVDSGDPLVSQEMVILSASRAVAVDSACKHCVFIHH